MLCGEEGKVGMSDEKKCRECGKSFVGIFGSVSPTGPRTIAKFKKYDLDLDGMCIFCAEKLVNEKNKCRAEDKVKLQKRLEAVRRELLESILVQTVPHYESLGGEILGVASGFSVIGTGPITAIASAFTDMFGKESIAYLEKIRTGEANAMNMAKLQCLELGGNLISGLALSVSEATSGNGMLMISCVGTAVRTPHISENISEYTALKREIEKRPLWGTFSTAAAQE